MHCNCKATEIVLGIVILVFAFWQTVASKWIIVAAAILLILHAFSCTNCGVCGPEETPKTKKRRRKR